MNVVSIAPMLLCLLAHKSNGIAASEPWGMPRARAPFPTLCHRRARLAAGTRKRRSRYRSTCCKLVKLPLGWHGSGGGRMKGPAASETSRFELMVYVLDVALVPLISLDRTAWRSGSENKWEPEIPDSPGHEHHLRVAMAS